MQPAPVAAGMQRHSMRGTEREPERLARRMPRMRRDIPRRRHNEHEAPLAGTIAQRPCRMLGLLFAQSP